MPAFFRIRLEPHPEYGYEGRVWVGIPPAQTAPRFVADLTTDRSYSPSPAFPPGSTLYRYPHTVVVEDARPEPSWSMWWAISQYIPVDGPPGDVEFGMQFGLLPETPILTEKFDIGIRIDGVSQAQIADPFFYSDGALVIRFDGDLPAGQTYRISMFDDSIGVGEPDPDQPEPTQFWTRFVGSHEVK